MSVYGFRYYLPELGRWAIRDPIGKRGGINIFAFVVNRPLDRGDRFGLWSSLNTQAGAAALRFCAEAGGTVIRQPAISQAAGTAIVNSAILSRVATQVDVGTDRQRREHCCCECVTDANVEDRGTRITEAGLSAWTFSLKVTRIRKKARTAPGGQAILSWTETSNRLPEEYLGYCNGTNQIRVTDYPTLFRESDVFKDWYARDQTCEPPRRDTIVLTDDPAADLNNEGPRLLIITVRVNNPRNCGCTQTRFVKEMTHVVNEGVNRGTIT